ncbi:hypothetical protein G4B88_020436 [Cannabis sativa]|uniref:Uncharacterized protein n=1 Tax=Cannabis sativa TaxID=3483 RepID=A0A7J6FF36_CANSA|nr:hypothetical protein G4B88_020436 [Cannabis sativa]
MTPDQSHTPFSFLFPGTWYKSFGHLFCFEKMILIIEVVDSYYVYDFALLYFIFNFYGCCYDDTRVSQLIMRPFVVIPSKGAVQIAVFLRSLSSRFTAFLTLRISLSPRIDHLDCFYVTMLILTIESIVMYVALMTSGDDDECLISDTSCMRRIRYSSLNTISKSLIPSPDIFTICLFVLQLLL